VRPGRDDRGAGSILATAMLGLLVTVTMIAGGVVGLIASHRTAQAAADLASLAGASALQDGHDACGRASTIARRNRAELRSCRIDGWVVVVVVVVRTAPLPGAGFSLEARARAGPVDDLGGR
jgi:secretion/DNA translocation related TadE-like protein